MAGYQADDCSPHCSALGQPSQGTQPARDVAIGQYQRRSDRPRERVVLVLPKLGDGDASAIRVEMSKFGRVAEVATLGPDRSEEPSA